REVALCLLTGHHQALPFDHASPQLDLRLSPKLVGRILREGVVKIISAEPRISFGPQHPVMVSHHVQNAEVEGTAAEVIDGNNLVLLPAQPVGQGTGDGYLPQIQGWEMGERGCATQRTPLRFVEAHWNADHGLLNRTSQVRARNLGGPSHDLRAD